ncbi:SUR7/PalI family-domain-containing protein [Scheffersomyces xylosifermentans]|uniref:SUR7/PalI family-domain-containing protein n=1 Tax=Scheffersomyces xylosifermentans TaxID=1304137 RepID=UPI00315D3F3E
MRASHTVINLFFLSGTILLLIFIILSGSSHHFPLDRFYWLSADTSGIRNAPNKSAWTFWGVCEKNDFTSCTLGPAYPISPVDNFSTTNGVPQKFIDNRDSFYYLTRFSFAFTIVALCFSALALIIDVLGFCFLVVDKVVIFLVTVGAFFLTAFAAFQTATVVLAKNAFHDAGLDAHIGVKSMALLWAAVVCLGIVWLNTFSSNIANSYRKHIDRVNANKAAEAGIIEPGAANDQSSFTRSTPAEEHKEEDNSGGIRFFKIKRNHKTSDEESV